MPKGYADPNNLGNSSEFHTGQPCIERGCDEPAGTSWSPHWCFKHNVERIDRISTNMEDIMARFEEKR